VQEIKGLSVENVRVDMEVTDQFGLPWDIGAAAGSILEMPGDNGYTLSDRRLGPNGEQGFPLDRWRIPVGVGTNSVRERVLNNIEQSRLARESSNFSEYVRKEVVEQLTRAQGRNVNTLGNIVDNHLKDSDFSGTLADLQGNPIPKQGGGYWDHLQEMKNSFTGLKSIKSGLEGSLQNPNLTPQVRTFLQDQLDIANAYIKEIQDLFKPFGGIK